MLTKWGKKVVACAKNNGATQYYIPTVGLANTSVAYIEAKNAGGTTVYINPYFQATPVYTAITAALVASGSGASYGVAFGSSNTAATENDYTLGSQVTGITVSTTPSVETVFDSVNYRYIAKLDYVVQNNTGSDVTIKEIGFFIRFLSATTRGGTPSSTSANRTSIMMDRTVLDSPVTIPSGTAGVVRYAFAYES